MARDACVAGRNVLGCIVDLYEKRLRELAAMVTVNDAYANFTRGNTGGLRIVRFGSTAAVKLWATGANGHECGFEYDALEQGGKGVLRWRETTEYEQYKINIVPEGDDMRVEGGCRHYCGARASMDGLYTRVP